MEGVLVPCKIRKLLNVFFQNRSLVAGPTVTESEIFETERHCLFPICPCRVWLFPYRSRHFQSIAAFLQPRTDPQMPETQPSMHASVKSRKVLVGPLVSLNLLKRSMGSKRISDRSIRFIVGGKSIPRVLDCESLAPNDRVSGYREYGRMTQPRFVLVFGNRLPPEVVHDRISFSQRKNPCSDPSS